VLTTSTGLQSVDFSRQWLKEEFGIDPLEGVETMSELLVKAEEVKKQLSASVSSTIAIDYNGKRGCYRIDRETFRDMTSHLMERTISLSLKVIDDVGIDREGVDYVLLVGGSTRMAMVREFIKTHFQKEPLPGINVDEAVALGAAIVAAERSAAKDELRPQYSLAGGKRVRDVTNHSLGMIAMNSDCSAYLNSIILPKNMEIPCTQSRPYKFRQKKSGQGALEVFMTQGESESPGDVSYLGMYVFHDIPFVEGGTIVDVQYSYDVSGTVNVAGLVRSTRCAIKISVEPLPPDVPERFLKAPDKAGALSHITVYISVDLSGSMSGEPLEKAKSAAKSFLGNIDLSFCSVGVIAFSDRVHTKLEACQNARKIKNAIESLEVSETGIGNEAQPFDEALHLLSGTGGGKYLITLTDGCWSHQQHAVKRAKECHNHGIEVIAIGFGGADKSFLKRIASSEDNSIFTTMSSLVETFSSIAQVLTETSGGLVEVDKQGGKVTKPSLLSFLGLR